MKLIKKREPMLVGEIIEQAVREGRLLKSLTKDVEENECKQNNIS